jgi:hypothetical protein
MGIFMIRKEFAKISIIRHKGELINKAAKDKIVFTDITKER